MGRGAEEGKSKAVREAELWAMGQVVTARASLDLLGLRATRAIQSDLIAWPEFAEYRDCSACHHEIDGPLRNPKGAGYLSGFPPWDDSKVFLIEPMARLVSGKGPRSEGLGT